jgi:DNA (cytosine-5)-methyltransferase 1
MVQPGHEVIVESQPALFETDYHDTILEQQHVLRTIHEDLEQARYSVQMFIIPACAVGAPHRRNRVFIVAHRANARAKSLRKWPNDFHEPGTAANAESDGGDRGWTDGNGKAYDSEKRNIAQHMPPGFSIQQTAADASSKGLQGKVSRNKEMLAECFPPDAIIGGCRQNDESKPSGQPEQNIPDWKNFPTQPPLCRRNDGFPGELAGLTLPAWRRKSIKAFGNAIVPQEMYEFFKIIDEIEKEEKS